MRKKVRDGIVFALFVTGHLSFRPRTQGQILGYHVLNQAPSSQMVVCHFIPRELFLLSTHTHYIYNISRSWANALCGYVLSGCNVCPSGCNDLCICSLEALGCSVYYTVGCAGFLQRGSDRLSRFQLQKTCRRFAISKAFAMLANQKLLIETMQACHRLETKMQSEPRVKPQMHCSSGHLLHLLQDLN